MKLLALALRVTPTATRLSFS